MKGLAVVGNNGSFYLLEKTEEMDFTGLYQALQNAIQIEPKFDADPKAYNDFMENFLQEVGQYGYRYQKG